MHGERHLMRTLLALEDGRCFEGESVGSTGTACGEICFNTSMTGYQEVLTDPSYCGQIVAMTYPLIGNYGANALDQESTRPHLRGFVVEEMCVTPSSWRSEESLGAYLARWGIVGIEGVDTRALTRHLRTRGAMKACLTTEFSTAEAVARASESDGVVMMDFVKEVTAESAYDWDPTDQESREWAVSHPRIAGVAGADVFLPLPPVRNRIAAIDLGIKKNILRRLRQRGFQVRVFPATTTAAELLAWEPDGVFLSNGPGDPAALDYVHELVRGVLGHKPVFGICLGHQVLGYAYGGRTFKLKFGHRGGNQPVKDLLTGRVAMTSQNHGFAVDADSLPTEVDVTHLNLNDQTVEGMRHRELPVFSVQYHPEAAPGPNDAAYLFDEFAKLIAESKGA